MDISRIPESGCCCLFIPIFFFLFFFSLQCSNIKVFVTFSSGTVRPRRLKLGTHVDSGQMYRIYRNQAAAAYSSLYFFNFLSLRFSSIKTFRRTVRPRKLKLHINMNSRWMYCVYRN